jgi:hypothetical protein
MDYAVENEKTANLITYAKVYRQAELNTDHLLLCAKLQFPQDGTRRSREN